MLFCLFVYLFIYSTLNLQSMLGSSWLCPNALFTQTLTLASVFKVVLKLVRHLFRSPEWWCGPPPPLRHCPPPTGLSSDQLLTLQLHIRNQHLSALCEWAGVSRYDTALPRLCMCLFLCTKCSVSAALILHYFVLHKMPGLCRFV